MAATDGGSPIKVGQSPPSQSPPSCVGRSWTERSWTAHGPVDIWAAQNPVQDYGPGPGH